MSDWLYPLSSISKRWFVGETDTSLPALKRRINRASVDTWYLVTNYRRVAEGDRVWCYYGHADGNVGVVALATIDEVVHDEARGKHHVVLRWEKAATRRLLARPVPAETVRKFVQRPRAAVWGLDPHPALVRTLRRAAGR
jgi:hypothetical protein